MKILIKQEGIFDEKVDCVVNAANDQLMMGGGVCGIIFNKAGVKELSDACSKYNGCPTGSAVITPGFKASKYIIHAVGPIWTDGKHHEPQDLYSCYQKIVSLALENKISSLACPLISGGIFGYPTDKCCRKALQALKDYDASYPSNLKFIFTIPEDYKYQEMIKAYNNLFVKE